VIRHSGATQCRIRIDWHGRGLMLEVDDNGRGLAPGSAGRVGHGLASIEGRIRGLAGWHRFEAGANGGPRLAAWIPLQTPSANIDTV